MDEKNFKFKKSYRVQRKNIQQNSFSVAKSEFGLWREKFKIRCYTLPPIAIDGLNLCGLKIFYSVFIHLKILTTLTVSTSTAERSFPHYGESKPTSVTQQDSHVLMN